MATNGQRQDSFKESILGPKEPVSSKTSTGDRRVGLTLALLNNYQTYPQLSMDDLATRVHLSPSRLRQLFKAETGISPVKYRRLLRLERAKSLLENSFLSVKEIVAEVGYGDVSHFVRDFRNRYKIRPLEARSLSSLPSHYSTVPPR
jgi:transcriptional regulator GlxA family with amidase domain